ncbi:MAG: hypothetical protein MJZ93_07065, partial [Paludibacteraceae bacterium]|nr:hypothetical protein [Paludibacteraceae bacterium]
KNAIIFFLTQNTQNYGNFFLCVFRVFCVKQTYEFCVKLMLEGSPERRNGPNIGNYKLIAP